MTTPTWISGVKQVLWLADETDWGDGGGVTPTWNEMPVTDYSVIYAPENRRSKPMVGNFAPRHSHNYKGMLNGGLSTALFGWHIGGVSGMQYLLDWAFNNPDTKFLNSKAGQFQEEDVANKYHKGLRVNTIQIAGSEDSGQLTVQLALMGVGETNPGDITTDKLTDLKNLADAEFNDVIFKIGGTAVPISAFQLGRNNGLKPRYLNSRTIQMLNRGACEDTFQFTVMKDSDTYDAARRNVGTDTDFSLSLEIKALHMGDGADGTTMTKAVATMPKARFLNVSDTAGGDDVKLVNVSCILLHPDTTSGATTWAYTDV